MAEKPTRQDWIDALRSGRYRQQSSGGLVRNGCFCCLGVWCKISGFECGGSFFTHLGSQSFAYLIGAMNTLGLRSAEGYPVGTAEQIQSLRNYIQSLGIPQGTMSLVGLNDREVTFEQIADIVERFPHLYFED